MQLQSSILIHRTPEQVWSFLGDPTNVPKWDRGVAGVEETTSQPTGIGYEFNTVAHDRLNLPDQGRMTYRIKESNPAAGRCIVELTSRTGNARFFKTAEWRFDIHPAPEGSHLNCTAIFTLRWNYLFLGPMLYLGRKQIMIDLECLKQAIESNR
ncbi:SRPBCC family protein [Acidicapsa dinghuensis]|uniref:SRPBCC family protein n=1 Tax=Acidicapsa dinghuensis TaxID=2218256 RepID=A0ABW1EJN8_9BACT|nr:SRPBCC family protein [Acidicapsa dinghuensis]